MSRIPTLAFHVSVAVGKNARRISACTGLHHVQYTLLTKALGGDVIAGLVEGRIDINPCDRSCEVKQRDKKKELEAMSAGERQPWRELVEKLKGADFHPHNLYRPFNEQLFGDGRRQIRECYGKYHVSYLELEPGVAGQFTSVEACDGSCRLEKFYLPDPVAERMPQLRR